jgi:predicted AlkP superfamily phosphohydrolase/phosphomutase
MRRLIPAFALIAILAASHALAEKRVIILGFDGVDPGLVSAMIEKGELPNLAALSKEGSFAKLGSSNPPQSPTAWSSFATAKNPGNHGIYDFLRRNPARYLPMVGFGQPTPHKLAADGSVTTAAKFTNYREGETFWAAADKQGAKAKILSVPFTYPAENLAQGCVLPGLGVPDVRGTTSTLIYMSDAFTAQEMKKSLSGGLRVALDFVNDEATVQISGPRDVLKKRTYLEAPLTVKADRAGKAVTVVYPGGEATLKEGEWSSWIEWSFEASPQYTINAISRIHVLEAGDQVRLYMTCLQYDPAKPYIPFATPGEYGAELKERYGNFKTIGWIYDTHGLRQDVLTEELFLNDVNNTMAWREQLTLDEIDRGNFDLLVSAWTGTDRVSHLFWAYRDPAHPMYTEEGAAKYGQAVENTYRKMDVTIGKVRAKLKDDDLLMIMSDHGFHSFRTGFNVNTWLIRNGYLAVKGKSDPATAFTNTPFLQGFDWPKSQAYCIGLGSIFLNIKGREGKGTVAKADADALIAEIREKLLAVTDPETGEKVFSDVYTRDYFSGSATEAAPDIQLGYAEGYQSTKDAAKGAAPEALFEPNTDKWSGEHASSDIAHTQGILFSNQTLTTDDPTLIDLGVTALQYLGKEVPADYEGKPIL